MSIGYHYAFSAPGTTPPEELEDFLLDVEEDARDLKFKPTMVFNMEFNLPHRLQFVRQLTTGLALSDEKLKGVVLLRDDQVWNHDPETGFCQLIPQCGVVLMVTNTQKQEAIFGFFQYPAVLMDLNDREVVATHQGDRWIFQSYVNSADPRYRLIVQRFGAAGYLETERDEFGKA